MDIPTRFLSTLWQGGQFSYFWTAPKRLSYWLPVNEVATSYCPNGGQNVYFGINPVTQIPAKNARNEPKPKEAVRSRNKYISSVNCLFAEFDFKDFGNTGAIKQHLKQFPFPSIAIASGGGFHLYWLLDKTFVVNTIDDLARAQVAQANWVKHLGGDKQSKDLARVLRVPGTRNYKPVYAPNYPLVKFEKEDYSVKYTLSELEAISKPEPAPTPPPLPTPTQPVTSYDAYYYQNQVIDSAKKMIQEAPDGEKHGTLLRASRLMGGYVAGGIITETVAVTTLEYEIAQKPNVDSLKAAYETIKRGIEYGKEFPITLEQKIAEREAYLAQNRLHSIKFNEPQPNNQPDTNAEIYNVDILQDDSGFVTDFVLIEDEARIKLLARQGFEAVALSDASSFLDEWINLFPDDKTIFIALDPGSEQPAYDIWQRLKSIGKQARLCQFSAKPDDFFTIYNGTPNEFLAFLQNGRW